MCTSRLKERLVARACDVGLHLSHVWRRYLATSDRWRHQLSVCRSFKSAMYCSASASSPSESMPAVSPNFFPRYWWGLHAVMSGDAEMAVHIVDRDDYCIRLDDLLNSMFVLAK